MRFEEWEPIYLEIIKDMGYDRTGDEQSARILSGILMGMERSRLADIKALEKLVSGRDVLVCGNAPDLSDDLKDMDTADYCIIAADGAAAVLINSGVVPHIIVTDLDGDIEEEVEAGRQGALLVVHAHGDNIPAIQSIVPGLSNVIGTTQAAPIENVHNFGGFTDGDRCVFLAQHFGASSITLTGFDFDDPDVTDSKKKKLGWARRLIDLVLRM